MSMHKVLVVAVLEAEIDTMATSPNDLQTVEEVAEDVINNLPRDVYLPFSSAQAVMSCRVASNVDADVAFAAYCEWVASRMTGKELAEIEASYGAERKVMV